MHHSVIPKQNAILHLFYLNTLSSNYFNPINAYLSADERCRNFDAAARIVNYAHVTVVSLGGSEGGLWVVQAVWSFQSYGAPFTM